MAALLGNWQLDRHENMDDYMKAVGVNILVRKVGLSLTSYEEIKQDGDCWEIHITSTFKNAQLKFKLGEEFEEETMDGRKVKSTFALEGDKLIHHQTAVKEGGENSTITREVEGETLVITFVALKQNVTAKRFYKRYTK
ncbi:fatty acid-binding protein homolog 6-like [Haliotis cracherodii]|uniref:fatty acid-binding protein homolog 6-like n=1 Tax=Haliotis cracherodii TaxID=6455 RepID=UPI0039E87991